MSYPMRYMTKLLWTQKILNLFQQEQLNRAKICGGKFKSYKSNLEGKNTPNN